MATVAVLVLLAAIPAIIRHLVGSEIPPVFFAVINSAVAVGWLVSLGSFLGNAMAELAGVRLARVIPGLRRAINLNVLVTALIVAAGTAVFWSKTVPRSFLPLDGFTLWALCFFLFSLGLGFGRSWLTFIIEVMLVAKALPAVSLLSRAPLTGTLVLLLGAAGLLALRYHRFLAPPDLPGTLMTKLAWFFPVHAGAQRARRTTLVAAQDRAHWNNPREHSSLSTWVKAGAYERLGQKRGGLLASVLVSVALVYGLYGLIIFWAWKSGRHEAMTFGSFLGQLIDPNPDQPQFGKVARGLLAALTAGVGYVCAVMHDTSLLPNLWHPISRDQRGRAAFRSHLRQNVFFALIHLVVVAGGVLFIGQTQHVPFSASVLLVFIMPTLVTFFFMPIPQAIFPNGAEKFRRKVNPLMQLLAGLLGGLLSLAAIYWVTHWPAVAAVDSLSVALRGGGLLVGTGAIYWAYYAYARNYYARAELRPREA
ncbi:MAG: hypothetical protein JWM32_2001 [Verrucomicrobia bacterium]|nr:hypothetical protein [Verrucomicrobiota bacterium]